MLELLGDVVRQQVLAEAQDLSQLDVGGPQQLETPPKLDGERGMTKVPTDEGPQERRKDALQPDSQAVRRRLPPARGRGR